jgi:hypothetical protein
MAIWSKRFWICFWSMANSVCTIGVDGVGCLDLDEFFCDTWMAWQMLVAMNDMAGG